jgi:hypothetical protein
MEKTKYKFTVPYEKRQIVRTKGTFFCEINASSKKEALEIFESNYKKGWIENKDIFIHAKDFDPEYDDYLEYFIDIHELNWKK